MEKPLHIALILPDLRFGGGQRVLLQLAGCFLALGSRVDIVNLAGDGELMEELPLGVGHVALVSPKSRSKWRLALAAVPRLALFLRRERPDAILSSMTGTNLATLLASGLVAYRGRIVLREAASTANSNTVVLRIVKALYRRASTIISVSNGVADDLRRLRIPDDRLVVIPNPVDVEKLRSRALAPCLLPDVPYIISVGRMTPQKDHATLLRAYSISDAKASHRLVIVGGGQELVRLQHLAIELNIDSRVDFTGPLDNPFPWISGGSLFVLSSRWEGYPNVLLEALALGVPVVSTDCPSGPSELLDDGKYGLLVAVGDISGLAAAIDTALTSSPTSVQAVLDMHRPELIAKRYMRVMEGVV